MVLSLGLAMVIGHNLWSGGALPILVTAVGWLTLIKGLVFLTLPPTLADKVYKTLYYEPLFFVYMSLTFALGRYLTVSAFSA